MIASQYNKKTCDMQYLALYIFLKIDARTLIIFSYKRTTRSARLEEALY